MENIYDESAHKIAAAAKVLWGKCEVSDMKMLSIQKTIELNIETLS